ncbi:MAG TPA: cyclodeaminase/cyclohydrolase family protein [Ignavibacteriales bacterium]|nr:cyclodeaminase/cyclohydrolase family protein [Ignavibacteriales bacterium]HOL81287.1 cyclodeaminase/cyclohydrolase family protein [Ignavibacteriales bacterium]HOM66057.1 cyclodeaminase/cyclohydrolase family protein [Ignavibacteriales bacterium]HPD67549.1 cyclodeaminase/cyclohydrolase family protein [Ignavibacteriales bacterium]HPP33397.1 cyclodeaminase/cyclohydrolase family protein [Ignavibacteriales bacterium]
MENLTIKQYLDTLSSNSPTPGGGNVSALCGSLASALAVMVTNLTIGKKKYADVENKIIELKEKVTPFINKFIELAEKDNQSFDEVMKAFSLPKETDEQKAYRSEQIEKATIKAAEIPFEVIKNANSIIDNFIEISNIGNQNSLSDIGVGLLLLKTATQGAYLNVIINISSLKDKEFANKFLNDVDKIYKDTLLKVDNTYNNIIHKLLN